MTHKRAGEVDEVAGFTNNAPAAHLRTLRPMFARDRARVHGDVDHDRTAPSRDVARYLAGDRRGPAGEPAHYHPIARLRCALHALELLFGKRQRLLHEYVLARLQRAHDKRRMTVVA